MTEAVEILLVEDNPHDVELTLRALTEHRIVNRVHVARDGVEALDFLFGSDPSGPPLAARPRLILLDLKLPRVSGLEVLQRLKAEERTRTIPVVILSSSREEPDVAEAYRLGANSYVVKPVEFGQFAEAVRQIGLYWVLLNQPPVP
jgi:two-component system response regulator